MLCLAPYVYHFIFTKQMCGCKKGKKGKRGRMGISSHSKVPKRYKPVARKYPPVCIKCSKAKSGVYMKGKRTRRKAQFRQKTIGARRGRKRGGQWTDDDYLANMPVRGARKKNKAKENFTWLG